MKKLLLLFTILAISMNISSCRKMFEGTITYEVDGSAGEITIVYLDENENEVTTTVNTFNSPKFEISFPANVGQKYAISAINSSNGMIYVAVRYNNQIQDAQQKTGDSPQATISGEIE